MTIIFVEIRLITNCYGASVSKSPATSAWPLFIAIADLPLNLRQSLVNIALAALFMGTGHPNINIFFGFLMAELAVVQIVLFENRSISVKFFPNSSYQTELGNQKIWTWSNAMDVIAVPYVSKMGIIIFTCTTKKLRSFDSLLDNLRALEDAVRNNSKQNMVAILISKFWHKGRSSFFSVITIRLLPFDIMHQLMLCIPKSIHFLLQ